MDVLLTDICARALIIEPAAGNTDDGILEIRMSTRMKKNKVSNLGQRLTDIHDISTCFWRRYYHTGWSDPVTTLPFFVN
jgi:hypothetical protein